MDINYLFTILCCSIFQCFCKEESSFFLAKNDLKCVLLVSKGETLMVVNLEAFNQLQNLDFWSNKISEENLVKRFSIQNILQGKLTYHKYIPYQYRSTYLKFYRVLYWLYDSFLYSDSYSDSDYMQQMRLCKYVTFVHNISILIFILHTYHALQIKTRAWV